MVLFVSLLVSCTEADEHKPLIRKSFSSDHRLVQDSLRSSFARGIPGSTLPHDGSFGRTSIMKEAELKVLSGKRKPDGSFTPSENQCALW